jgi:hypothetical protein
MEAASGARLRTVPSLLETTRATASRTVAAGVARLRTASSPLEPTRGTVRRMAGASGARLRTASSPPKATRGTARRMAEAGGASTWAVPRLLKQAARPTASRMEGAGGASTRAAPSTSPKLPAVCTARYVSSASSPTMRRTMHRNSLARPKPRVGSRSWCESSTGGGGWRDSLHAQPAFQWLRSYHLPTHRRPHRYVSSPGLRCLWSSHGEGVSE